MKKYILTLFSLFLVLALLFTSCSEKPEEPNTPNVNNTDKTALNVSIGSATKTLDPVSDYNIGTGSVILHIFEGLFTLSADKQAVPAQAESFTKSADGLSYTFKLRESLKWSDGSELSAEDFVYSWNRAAKSTKNYAYLFKTFDKNKDGSLKLEATDARTLVLTLNAPTPYLPDLLTLPIFCPVKRDMVDFSASGWSVRADSCVGNGPYKLSEITEDSMISLVKNGSYRNAQEVKTEKINFIKPAINSDYDAYMSGEIMFADTIPATKLPELLEKPYFHTDNQLGIYFFIFNTSKRPMNNENLRKALSLAIDRNYISREICHGINQPAFSVLPQGLMSDGAGLDYRTKAGQFIDGSKHEENLLEAKKLLKEAGYPEGKNLAKINFSCEKTTENELIAEAVKKMWAELGVTLEIHYYTAAELILRADNGQFEIMKSSWLCDYRDPSAMLEIFSSKNNMNYSKWTDSQYEKDLTAARKETDANKRYDLFYKCEKLLFEEAAVCPIYFADDIYLQSENLKNVIVSPFGYKNFAFATIS